MRALFRLLLDTRSVGMMWFYVGIVVATTIARCCVDAREFSEHGFQELPELYHMDEYDRCLSEPSGLYCTGTFHITSPSNSTSFQATKKYSVETLHFNRSLLHRGYCVSTCNSHLGNLKKRFEKCAQERVRQLGIQINLQSHQCVVHGQQHTHDAADWTLLWAAVALLLLNCFGTLYDLKTNGMGKKPYLMAWSVRANFQRLTATYKDGDPRLTALSPIQGFRVLLMVLVIISHATQITHKLYLYNPHHLEQLFQQPLTMFLRNGSAAVQVLVVLSNFLFGFSLLVLSKSRKIGFLHLPLCLMQRLIRLMPLHLAVVGFAATWWRWSGDGPQWSALVADEGDVCRRKFWLHTLFLHNLFDNDEHCLLQTWFLAVDFQLFVVSSVTMLTLIRVKWSPVPVLSALVVLACLLNIVLAYANGWQALLYVTAPEILRESFRGVPSFRYLYISPVGSLPACFIGLLIAQIHHDIQEKQYNINKNKIFVWIYHLSIPLLVGWIMAGIVLYEQRSPLVTTTYVAVERPVFALLSAVCLLGAVNNIDNPVRRLMSWRGWQALGRMSLSALMMHWCVNKTIVASRRTLTEATASDIFATCFLTYCLAVPATVLIEMPFTRTFTSAIS